MSQTVIFTELTINQVSEAAKAIRQAFAEQGDVVVDLQGVPVTDTAAVQLLIAAKKEAETLRRSIRFEHVDTVANYMSRIGAAL